MTTGIWPLYEVEDGVLQLVGKSNIADGRLKRLPVRYYLLKQGRFAHFTEDDIAYFQSKVDETWEKMAHPGRHSVPQADRGGSPASLSGRKDGRLDRSAPRMLAEPSGQ